METTQEDRDTFRVALNSAFFLDLPATRALLNDADRLETVERDVRELANLWSQQQSEYPDSENGKFAAAAVRCCIRELLAILDPKAET